MEQNNILEVRFQTSKKQVLIDSIEKFKRQYALNFEVKIDEMNKIIQVNLEELSANDTFMMGYYYGCLEYIDNRIDL